MFSYNSATGRAFRQLPKEARLFLFGIFAICYSILVMIMYHDYLFTGDVIDINEKLVENNNEYTSDHLVEEFCRVEVNAGYGSFFVPSSSSRSSFKKKDGGYYYIAYLEDNSVMAIKVKESELSALDVITKSTAENGKANTSITYEGLVTEMELGDNAKKYTKTLSELGISDTDVRIRYIRLDATTNRNALWLQSAGFMALGILLIFGDIIIQKIKEKKRANTPVESTVKVDNNDIEFYKNDTPTNLYSSKMNQGFSFAGESSNTPRFNETDNDRSGSEKISISGRDLMR